MTTLGDVVTDVQRKLRSYTGQHEQSTHLTLAVGSGDLTLTVADGDAVRTGMVQVDDELVYVSATSGATLTIPPYGRGYEGSTAAAHSVNAQVLVDPFFPRVNISDEINNAALALYPRLFQVKTKTFTFSPARTTYDLAADLDRVLSVTFQQTGGSGVWPEINRWSIDHNADTTVYPSGKSITLGKAPMSGSTVRVTYAGRFDPMTAAADVLTAKGFAESHRDVLTLGACWRLVQFLEPARLNLTTPQNQERAQYATAGSASTLTRQLLGLYEQRISEERALLLSRWPVRPHHR